MIAERGPAEFGVNSLARALGYTPGALYWYFPSKEALVGEVQQQVFSEFGEDLAKRRESWLAEAEARGDAAEVGALYVLLRFARYYLTLDATQPEYLRMIAFSLDPRIWLDDEQGKQLGPLLMRVFQQVAMAFAYAARQEALAEGPGAARAVQYWTALQGMTQTGKLARLAPGLFDPLRLGMGSARSLLLAWGADPCALDTAEALMPLQGDADAATEIDAP